MSQTMYWARISTSDPERRQPLEEHLRSVAQLAAGFCRAFRSEAWGYVAGLWHDLGKYQAAFQQRLLGENVACEHSGAGAVWAIERARECELKAERGLPLAFAIAGHHVGLANLVRCESDPTGPGLPLCDRLNAPHNRLALNEARQKSPQDIMSPTIPNWPSFLESLLYAGNRGRARRSLEFWVRFLFSALVDADRLDSEAFDDPRKASLRASYPSINELRRRLDEYIDRKISSLSDEDRRRPVNVVRARVLEACRLRAAAPQGIFSLTVPTGGGKTLSSLAFALRHAEQHGLRRAIVVIPYTSIIEQNSAVYREALGSENVLEHHSNLDPEQRREQLGEMVAQREELAAENWDAPVIVTTTVQFFESLFTSRPSAARKLHNIARSVIVFDEVQTLPPGFLLTILDALRELTQHYGCSIVLSTATPPALQRREALPQGLEPITPIVEDSVALARELARVRYEWPRGGSAPASWEALAAALIEHAQVLAIVHRRSDARELAEHVRALRPEEPVFHLSALMCPAHRLERLHEIRTALAAHSPCRVVATQLVEAGVDLDFPIVFRALGGLDSIVQAAGRCNREGRLPEPGRVVVFRAPTQPPRGTLRRALDQAESLLQQGEGTLDVDDPRLLEQFFRGLYRACDLDHAGIQHERESLNFATVNSKFRMIEDDYTVPVVIGWGKVGQARIDRLRTEGPSRETLRAIQPYTVAIPRRTFEQWVQDGILAEVVALGDRHTHVYTLSPMYTGLYDPDYGLRIEAEPSADAAGLIL